MRDATGRVDSVALFGGTSDIGLACVRALTADGARRAVLLGRDEQAMQRAGGRLGPADVSTLPFDALDTDAHGDLADRLFAAHGDLDVVVLAFGVLADQADAEDDPTVAVTQARINDVGVVSIGLHVARHLRRQGHGTLVVLSSVAAVRPRRANFAYGASKAGADSFARGLDQALEGSGARVMLVRPGFVRSAMTEGMEEAPFACEPDDVAQAVRRGLAENSRVVWAPPAVRAIAVVLRTLPAALLKRLPR